MDSERFYTLLCWHGTAAGAELFPMHVTASILALARQEMETEGRSLSELTGLDADGLRQLFQMLFPDALDALERLPLGPVEPDDEERSLRDILWMNSAEASPFEELLCRIIARRSLRPHHLWQDLGFGSRVELSKLMRHHFPRLAERNSGDMKWKKFFYRMMCASKDYTLCTSPICSECDDFDNCFGAEDGESMLAWQRNGSPEGKGVAVQS